MIKKIIYFSIFFFILFSHSSSYVFGACTNSCTNNASTWGNKRCLENRLQYGNDGGWTDHTYCDYGCSNCECNSPPATATPFHCQYSDSQQRCVGYCSSGYTCTQIGTSDTCICKLPPTNTPTPPTSTLAPCDHDGNNICNTPDPVCNFTCRPNLCIGNEPVQKYVTCRTREDCDVCYDSRPTYFYDPIHCGYCGGNPVPTGCQPYACYDMNTPQCPYTNFGNCPGGIGNCDNCGGQDCGTCDDHSPPGTTPVPTSPPGCVADCVNPNVSPCITTTCHNQTCQGNCGQYCYGTLPNDCSCAANLCSDQTCTGTCGGTCTGQVTCVTPTFNNLTIRRSDWFYTDRDASNGSDIMDGNNRIHICDPFIANHTNPRRLIYVVFVSTSNGWQDIASVRIRWLKDNVVKNMARITGYHDGDPANGELPDNQDVYHLIVNFNDSDNHSGNAYDHQVNVTSVKGNRSTGWINADRLLKVWDCNVSVSGGFFDSSGQPACTMTTPMPLGMVNNLAFGIGNSIVSANITGTSYSGANLHFAKSYLPYFNGGNASNIYGTLAVTSHTTKINNAANCTGVNDIGVSNLVDPYDDTTHQLQADFAFTRLMDPWYQIIGSGLRSRANLVWAVPITAPTASRYLTLNGTNLDHGAVFYGNQSNNRNGYNGAYSPVPNWHARTTLGRPSVYNYAYLYSRLFEKQGVGTTGTSWNQRPATGPFFVNGNLSINTNNSAFAGQPLLTVVQGNLTVNPTVTQLHGLFIINGNLDIGGSNTNPLIITGSVYTRGDAHISRSLIPQTNNNNNPAVIFQYQPGYMLNLPSEVTKVLSGWRME